MGLLFVRGGNKLSFDQTYPAELQKPLNLAGAYEWRMGSQLPGAAPLSHCRPVAATGEGRLPGPFTVPSTKSGRLERTSDSQRAERVNHPTPAQRDQGRTWGELPRLP